MTDAPVPRRGARLGAWAFALALLAPVWLGLTAVGTILAMSRDAPQAVGVVAYILFFGGFLVVPLSGLASLGLGIAALALNRMLGKVLGGIAVLVVAGSVVTLIWSIASGIAGGFSLV